MQSLSLLLFLFQCVQICFVLGADAIAFPAFLDGFIVHGCREYALLQKGQRLGALLDKKDAQQTLSVFFYLLDILSCSHFRTPMNLNQRQEKWKKECLAAVG